MSKLRTKDITVIAVLVSILFIQEELLTFIPNLQLTVFLLILYSNKLGFVRTAIIVLIHTLLDNLVMGSFNLFFFPAMLIGWMIIPLITSTVLKKVSSPIVLALFAFLFSLTYCWCFILPNYIVYQIHPLAYLASDIWWEIILATVSFLSILWLYEPCSKVFDKLGINYTRK